MPVEIGLPIAILRRIFTIWSITAFAGISNFLPISSSE
ncbi:putative membrane protein [Synechococcus sp. SYN20]|nr:putative membrane protein [Synechococcus sp. SYN20]